MKESKMEIIIKTEMKDLEMEIIRKAKMKDLNNKNFHQNNSPTKHRNQCLRYYYVHKRKLGRATGMIFLKRYHRSLEFQSLQSKFPDKQFRIYKTKIQRRYSRRWISVCGPHGRIHNSCVDCGGIGVCEHLRLRAQCKECGGSSICLHERRRSQCKDCNGSGICYHGRQWHQCKQCFGRSICVHHLVKYQCKACGGSSICKHQRVRSNCKKCSYVKKFQRKSDSSDIVSH